MKSTFSLYNFSFLILFGVALYVFYSCATLKPEPKTFIQEGLASWYGPEFHGRPTSSREIFNMHDLTAAHPTLPFGTYVMVTNLYNGQSVIVRINDRGPFVPGRIIDLSYAAARVIGAIGPGVIPVRLEVLRDISPSPRLPDYYIQLGAFIIEANAQKLYNELKSKYPDVFISIYKTDQTIYYRVRIKAKDREQAMRLAQILSEEGHPVLIIEE
ncbi:MAG: septal ring lytic transglycosylase RlpA family protein [Candidatus Aminicenantes bacterium]|nr:septal ring lytic transglycosylase RlpA family protein [Candidatus Aminicenantes bacterium]